MKTLIAITTFNRRESLCSLVASLLQYDGIEIAIFDDCSDWNVKRLAKKGLVNVIVAPEHRGKEGFWMTFNDIFAYFKDRNADYYMILPDDVEPCENFIEEAINAYKNAKCICISPLLTNRSIAPGISRWGKKKIERREDYYITHYFDCCTVCKRDFFEALNWYLVAIVPSTNPFRSSGVGRQITMRLQEQGKRMCHVHRTLLTITEKESMLNPEERKRTPMYADWRNNSDCVDVHIASLWRDGHLIKTVESLLNQPELHDIFITLNSYTDEQCKIVKSSLTALAAQYGHRIITRRCKNKKGSNEKLAQLSKGTAPYIAFADDDIIYPADYLFRLINGCNVLNGAVSFHGARLRRFPIKKYYNGARLMFCWNVPVEKDTRVEILGTGLGMIRREWFTDEELKDLYANAPTVSMDDIVVSCALADKGIARYVIAHPGRCVTLKEAKEGDGYVYDRYKDDDSAQVEYLNEHYKLVK